ncbi:hypothetical protein Poli38472_011044 [Pythium oligandrum]|uniref:GlcNac transferase n=1 Tax=Pythium oligandrum TaxID=41045 RepID=A0A8K1FNK5_PYTOL|nr:hypothetical protein Poli38472_011044 [Pythium oligandrum]|eukprot:TMW67424.1 hypothetical protein Poli38472_011044 [Pythium oligandrum]
MVRLAALLTALLAHGAVVSADSDAPPTLHVANGKGKVELDPTVQHIPLKPELKNLRPPPARVPSTFDIYVGMSVFRDGVRCGKTLLTGFKRATKPDNLYFGIVDQVYDGDATCIEEYCKLASVEWPEHGECRYREHIRLDKRNAHDSRGCAPARHYQQKLLRDEEFCLQIDGHSIFTNNWDENLVADWKQTDNEMAVLTTWLHDIHDFVDEDGNNNVPDFLPHLCATFRGGNGLVRTEDASMISGSTVPQLGTLLGGGFVFSKCHAERRVIVDKHAVWMSDGEEFLRGSHLWTYGYDLYSPSPLGSVVYHNYSRVPVRFETVKIDKEQRELEIEMGINRFHMIVGKDFEGYVDAKEMDKYAYGTVRSFQTYLNFSGVTFEDGKKDQPRYEQLHWVPYENPEEIEKLVGGGWKMYPTPKVTERPRSTQREVKEPKIVVLGKRPEHDDEAQLRDKLAGHGAVGGEPKEANLRQELADLVRLDAAKTDGSIDIGNVLYLLFFAGLLLMVAFSYKDLRRQCRRKSYDRFE